MWGTSRPLAATSVAIRILNFLSLKFFITVFRLLCLKPPCRAKALIFSLDKDLANFSVPYFVFTNIKIEPFLLEI